MLREIQYLADVRRSVTVPANSLAAVAHAITVHNIPRVLVEPILAPAGKESEEGIFFAPLHCREMAVLKEIPITEWIAQFYQKHNLPRLDSLEDLLSAEGLVELWLWLDDDRAQAEKIIQLIQKSLPHERRIVFAAGVALPETVYRCADPTAKRDYFFCDGSLGKRIRHAGKWNRSVAFRTNSLAAIRTKILS